MQTLFKTSITVPSPELVVMAALLPPGRAIDLGCGVGSEALLLGKHGWRVEAIDSSEDQIRAARRRRNGLKLHNVELLHQSVFDGYRPARAAFDLVNDRLFTTNLLRRGRRLFRPDGLSPRAARERLTRVAAHALRPGGVWVVRYPQSRDDRWGIPDAYGLSAADRRYASRWFQIGPELGYRTVFDRSAWMRLSIVALRRNRARPPAL